MWDLGEALDDENLTIQKLSFIFSLFSQHPNDYIETRNWLIELGIKIGRVPNTERSTET